MNFLQKLNPLHLIAAAILGRLIASATQFSWAHPDEWYHTIELSNYLASGIASFTEAFSLHIRNLTLPVLFYPVIEVANWLSDSSVSFRLWSIRFVVVLFSLSTLWPISKWIGSSAKIYRWNETEKLCAWMLFTLPFFTLADSVRPSQEHFSLISLYWALGFLTNRNWFVQAGIFAFLIAAFRYPSGLFTLGLTLWVFWRARDGAKRFVLGLFIGAFLGGISDWAIYGRPYESLWMYLQYNVFTTLGQDYYGSQPATVYLSYLWGHWRFLLPIAVPLLLLAPLGWYRALRKGEAWVLAGILYLVGHLLVAHKEPRFVFPFEFLLFYGGLIEVIARKKSFFQKRFATIVGFAVFLTLIINMGLFARGLWGETWRRSGTYQEIDRHLSRKDCGVVTVIRPMGTRLPGKIIIPSPTLGFFPARGSEPVFPGGDQILNRPVIWLGQAPNCRHQETILLHLNKPHEFWNQSCELLPSGVLRMVPKEHWSFFIKNNYVSGPWYRCPRGILREFKKQEVRSVLTKELPSIEKLPPYGVTAAEIRALSAKNTPRGMQGGVMVDW